MKRFKTLAAAILVIALSGCSTIKQLSYFEVEPYAKPLEKKIEIPVTIVLMEDVKDSFTVQGVGVKQMTVTNFRRSLAESLDNTIGRNFENVIFTDTRPDKGLYLVIYRVRPFWKINSTSSYTTGTGEHIYSTSKALVAAAFQYETSLFYNDEKIQDSDLTIFSDDQMSVVRQAHPVFKSGITKLCETINRDVFTDEVIAKITGHDSAGNRLK